ncbi:josephin family protein [Cryptosporidium muris RN66]|uniref:ubiquitinyl hydrolase 1 n=1 Tax=Cryptosporidium muris (strain RN66) TaxID=441375 RepID=B6AFX5_CRYMR|nr:josephin family protein [Cryptosporidium muris RN66]EEA07116.1 josephin family protein [Cryptosporidium muris RN66]|eukprot:XP_002141465.1 josephin family protein [Cryptosporidium muris RN66]
MDEAAKSNFPAIVYWEKQGMDRMCALHCINSLLQGPFVDEMFLSNIAHEIDELESKLLKSRSYYASENVADDGFFSIMVLQECLQRFGYICLPAANPEVQYDVICPSLSCGYIINTSEHWFCVRSVGGIWFNLDSLKAAPIKMEYTSVTQFLQNYVFSGKSVFVVKNKSNQNSFLKEPDPFIRPIADKTKQFYLSKQEIELLHRNKVAENDRNLNLALDQTLDSRSFLYNTPNQITKHNWPTSGGNTLSSNINFESAQLSQYTNEDDDLKKALFQSSIDFAASISLPQEPDLVQSDIFQIRVKLKDGSSVSRRFLPDQSIHILFLWLDKELALKGQLPQTQYSLICKYPSIKITRLQGEYIEVYRSESQITETIADFSETGLEPTSVLLLCN